MGADLYIESVFKPHHERLSAGFDKAIAERDSLTPGTVEYEAAQQRATECFDQMYAEGYFRDPYNSWDVLWKLGLTWWADVLPNVNSNGQLPVESVQELLDLVNERLDLFEINVSELAPPEQAYFRERLEALQQFLQKAIALDEAVVASL